MADHNLHDFEATTGAASEEPVRTIPAVPLRGAHASPAFLIAADLFEVSPGRLARGIDVLRRSGRMPSRGESWNARDLAMTIVLGLCGGDPQRAAESADWREAPTPPARRFVDVLATMMSGCSIVKILFGFERAHRIAEIHLPGSDLLQFGAPREQSASGIDGRVSSFGGDALATIVTLFGFATTKHEDARPVGAALH